MSGNRIRMGKKMKEGRQSCLRCTLVQHI